MVGTGAGDHDPFRFSQTHSQQIDILVTDQSTGNRLSASGKCGGIQEYQIVVMSCPVQSPQFVKRIRLPIETALFYTVQHGMAPGECQGILADIQTLDGFRPGQCCMNTERPCMAE